MRHGSHGLPAALAAWAIVSALALASCGGGEAPAATPVPTPPPAVPPPPAAPPSVPDTVAPSVPANVSATALSPVSIRVTWNASSDDVGVTGYRIFRDGNPVGTTAATTYEDLGLAAGTSYRYEVAAFDAAGNVSARSAPASASTQAAAGPVINAGPGDYLAKLRALRPGDTLVLAAGTYDDPNDVPGLPIFNLNGTPTQPITITGPEHGAPAVLLGRATHNTIRFANASYVIVRNLEVDGRNLGGFGVAVQGLAHHITLEGLRIRGVGGAQQIVGISTTGSPTWNWVIRRNVIEGAGTGMYLGNSNGGSPFVAGIIENNLIVDTIGYNLQIKHQVPWSNVPAGMPTGKTTTIIRNNVFVKRSNLVSPDGPRPNVLVGDQPASGPGSDNGFEIYGNFFYQNPTEALFQGEGNIAFYGNVMVNDGGDALNVQPHNGAVRDVRIFGNTIVASGSGIRVSGGAGYTQQVVGNAVFAATPISGGMQTANTTGSRASAATFLNRPTGALGELDLFPKAGALRGAAWNTPSLGAFTAWDRDFNGNPRDWTYRGAYSGEGTNPGWRLNLEVKP